MIEKKSIPAGTKLCTILKRFIPLVNERRQIAGIVLAEEEYFDGSKVFIMALNPLMPLEDKYFYTVKGVTYQYNRGFNKNHINQINRGIDNHIDNMRVIQQNRRLQDLGKWNYKEHKDRRLVDLADRFDWSTVYIIGNSPKIKENYHELANIKKGVVIGTNRCMSLFEPDILMLADPAAPNDWIRKSDKTVGVFDTCVNPYYRKSEFFNEYYWFNSFIFTQNPAGRWYHTWNLRQNIAVTCEAFELAIMMGAKNIIFAGCEHAIPLEANGVHWNDDKKFYDEHIVTSIIDGKEYKSNKTYVMTSLILSFFATCLTLMQTEATPYRVINATESGIMQMEANGKKAMEIITLKQAVEEMNSNISVKSPKYFLGNDF